MIIKISPKSILRANLYFIVLLLIANTIGIICSSYFDEKFVDSLVESFDFDTESNIPTFYSALALLVASGLLMLFAFNCKRLSKPYILWLGLSFIFLFLCVDEFDSIHELSTRRLRDVLETSGFLYYAWVIPYGCLVIAFVITYSRFLLQLPKPIMILFIISGALYVSGAIGFELIAGKHAELLGEDNITYSVYYTCEEFLEMTGIALFIYALLQLIGDQYERITIQFTRPTQSDSTKTLPKN